MSVSGIMTVPPAISPLNILSASARESGWRELWTLFHYAILESIEIFLIGWCDDGFEWFKYFRRVKSHRPGDFRRFREVFEISPEEEMWCYDVFEEYVRILYFEPLAHIRISSPIWCDHGKDPITKRDDIADFELVRKSRRSPPGCEEFRRSPSSENFFFWEGESADIGEGVCWHRKRILF